MIKIQIKKKRMETYQGLITPQALHTLKDNMHESRNCFAHYARDLNFEVDHYNTIKVVDLTSYTCNYRD